MRIRRRRLPLTAVTELNDLLAAGKSEREQLISGLSGPVVRGLLLHVLEDWGK